jgi:ribosomal protein S27E
MAGAGGYRCESCGNKTRFDVFETTRMRSFHHFTLGGELTVEEQEVLDRSVERVVCRWCGASIPVSSEVDRR